MGLPSRLQGKRVQVVIHTACVGDLDPPTQHPEKKKKKQNWVEGWQWEYILFDVQNPCKKIINERYSQGFF